MSPRDRLERIEQSLTAQGAVSASAADLITAKREGFTRIEGAFRRECENFVAGMTDAQRAAHARGMDRLREYIKGSPR